MSDGGYGIFCNYLLTEHQALVIESRDTIVTHWPMPKPTKSESFFDFRKRFQNPNSESIISELKTIREEIQHELFDLLTNELKERGYELVYDEANLA